MPSHNSKRSHSSLVLGGLAILFLLSSALQAHAASQLSLAWDNVGTPAGGFQVFRCTPPAGSTTCTPATPLVDLTKGKMTGLAWIDVTTTPGTLYCYGVEAIDAQGGFSPMSNVPCKVAPQAPLAAPTNVRFQ